jgi:hypothetical protein
MTTQTDVAQLYTAFFDRAPDAAGLAYWIGELDAGNINLAQMAKNWVDEQPEGQTKYPSGTSDADFIASIYNNVLGRAADTDGATYWQNQLASGAVSRDVFIQAIISGAHSNTSAQGVLDAQLLDNKAAVGIAFADQGINNTALAAKVLTTVTASDASLNSSLALIKLIPADASLTPALVDKFSSTIDKVAALIAGQPGEQADLATYLSTLSAGLTSSTNLDTLLTKIGAVATSALTDTTALDNPATLGHDDIAASNPPVGGGGGGDTPTDPVPTLTATSADGVLKIDGTSNADVRVDMTAHTVTSGATTVAVNGDSDFTGVDASTYGGSVTAVGTVKEIVSNNPVYTGVDRLEVVDKASTILSWAKYYLNDVQKITVLDGAAGTLTVDGHNELTTLTDGQVWTYDIRDSVSALAAAADSGVLGDATKVVVADTLANLQLPAGAAAIEAHPGYTVLDTYANIAAASAEPFFLAATDVVVHDTVLGVQAAITAGYVTAGSEYEVQDTATALLDSIATDPDFLTHPASVTVTGDDAGTLSLAQRDALGKVTDDDFWAYSIDDTAANILANAQGSHSDYLEHATEVTVTGNDAGTLSLAQRDALGNVTDDDSWAYSITDTAENIVANAQGDHSDYLQQATDVTVSDSVTLAQVGAVAAVPTIDTSNWHFSIVDSVANAAAYDSIGDLALTATASQVADTAETLNGDISTGAVTLSFAGLSDAASFTFTDTGISNDASVDTFTHFAAGDKIDLTAFGLTGEDTLSLDLGGNHAITDGHYAVIKGVALVDGAYTASTAADAGTLVIWDADTTGAIKQVGVFVADGTVDATALVLHAAAVSV